MVAAVAPERRVRSDQPVLDVRVGERLFEVLFQPLILRRGARDLLHAPGRLTTRCEHCDVDVVALDCVYIYICVRMCVFV